MLTSVLAWGSAPVRADDKPGHLGPHEVRVLTQNMYVGASLGILLQNQGDFATAIAKFTHDLLATKAAERAAAMAAEIAEQRPDFVALHEVWKLVDAKGNVVEDLLQYVLDALKALGQPYKLAHDEVHDAIAVVDAEELVDPCGITGQIKDRGAILMRTDGDIQIMNVQPLKFFPPISIPLRCNPPPAIPTIISTTPGFVFVDATVRGIPLRFVSVHLVPNPTTIEAHTLDLLDKTASPTLPLVFGGDFNTTANDPSNISYKLVYQHLIDAGLTDAWNPHIHRPGLGLTCCQKPLLNEPSDLTTRVDLILFSGAFEVEDINLIGNKETDRTPSGLWPSDHAGLVATLATPLCQIEGRCGR